MILTPLLCSLVPVPPVGSSVELRPKSVRTWTIELPADPFRPVSGSFPIPHAGGEGFAAVAKGVGLAVDTDGDGEVDRDVEGRVDAATGVREARVVLSGVDAEGKTFQYPVRLQSRGEGWVWAPSGVLAGDINGVPVTVVDLDGNGRYGDVGTDAIAVGGNVAQFFGETLIVGDELYSVDLEGTSLRFHTYEGPTGVLDLHADFDAKGVLLAAIVQTVDGRHSFELSKAEDGPRVPIGHYRLLGATLGLGESRVQADTSALFPLEVGADVVVELAWGGPLKATFEVGYDGGSLVFDPARVAYVGAAGERWTGWDPVGKSPVFKVKDKVTGDVLVDVVFPGSC